LLYIRSIIFILGYFTATVLYGTLSLLLFPLPVRIRHKIIITWTTVIIYMLRFVCGVKFEIIGKENLSKVSGPMVVLAKHQSTWETLYLQSLFWPASTVLKRELLRLPFFGWGLRALLPIAIDRSNPRDALRQVKSKGINRLQTYGYNVILFPEGTRMKAGERGKYARSGADIAIDANVPVVPVAVNSGYCWPSGSYWKYPGTISLVIGEPIEVTDKHSKVVTAEVENWIESTMETLLINQAKTEAK